MLKHLNFFNYIRTPFFFDANDGAGGGDGNPDDEAAKKKAAAEKAKQEALNKEFADRAARAAESERKKILADLGVTDPDEAKALIESARKADEANKSELDKEKAARAKAEQAAADAKAQAEKVAAEAQTRLLNMEIKSAALAPVLDKDKKVVRPAFKAEAVDDVLLLLNREGIKDEDGKFVGVDEALKELAKAKPWLLAEKQETQSKCNNVNFTKKPKSGGDETEDRPRIITSL